MEEVTYYAVQATGSFDVPANLLGHPSKDDYFVSPNGRLCGLRAMAMVLDPTLAERFRSLLLEKLRPRHGSDLELEIVRVKESGLGKQGLAKIHKSTEQTQIWCDKQEAV